jgi:hypothetical protein
MNQIGKRQQVDGETWENRCRSSPAPKRRKRRNSSKSCHYVNAKPFEARCDRAKVYRVALLQVFVLERGHGDNSCFQLTCEITEIL